MFKDLTLFQTSAAMAQHAGTRQAVVASNIANADTPGYRAMKLGSFQALYSGMDVGEMRRTRPEHIGGGDYSTMRAVVTAASAEPAPNGNSVSVEDEMLSAVSVSREHSRALAIYRHGLTVLRSTLGRS